MQIESNKAAALFHILLGSRNSRRKFYLTFLNVLFPIVALLTVVTSAYAESEDDKFNIELGGYTLTRQNSSMSLTNKNVGVGVSFSPRDTLGLKTKETTVLRMDGRYRFNEHNSLTFSWYSISSSGKRTLQQDIDWVDENGNPITIPAGASVSSSLDYDIFKLGYMWSFYRSDRVELALGAGLHTTRIALGITSDVTSSGVRAKSVKSTVPLPVLSYSLTYWLTPKFKWYVQSEAFALSYGDWDGTYSDNTTGVEYRLFRNVGLGAGIGNNSLNLKVDGNDYRFDYNNRITGILLYIAGHF